MQLDMLTVSGILPLGGTILRTSSFELDRGARARPSRPSPVTSSMRSSRSGRAHDRDHRGAPPRRGTAADRRAEDIDNDIVGTDYTFGSTRSPRSARRSSPPHHRSISRPDHVVEVMGRNAGWIALYGGIAGGADGIVIPRSTRRRGDRGSDHPPPRPRQGLLDYRRRGGAALSFESGEVPPDPRLRQTASTGTPLGGSAGRSPSSSSG